MPGNSQQRLFLKFASFGEAVKFGVGRLGPERLFAEMKPLIGPEHDDSLLRKFQPSQFAEQPVERHPSVNSWSRGAL